MLLSALKVIWTFYFIRKFFFINSEKVYFDKKKGKCHNLNKS